MKNVVRSLKDALWNALFLDFYLDPGWTLRFKLMNLISGDVLRPCLTQVRYDLAKINQEEMKGCPTGIYVRRAAYWTDAVWREWRK